MTTSSQNNYRALCCWDHKWCHCECRGTYLHCSFHRPFSSVFKKTHTLCLSSLSGASDLSYALLSRSDQDSAACFVWQARPLNSYVMSSLPYKLHWMWGRSPPHSSCFVRVTYISKWWGNKGLVLSRKTFSGHLLCTNSSTFNPSSLLKMEGLWLIQLMQKMAECLASFKYSMLGAHRLWASVRKKWQQTWPFSQNCVWKGGISFLQ